MKPVASAIMIALSLSVGLAAAQAAPASRAQVLSELHQAQTQGLISQGELGYPVEQAAASQKTRGQVQAELDAARDAGLLNVYGMNFPPHIAASTVTRGEVAGDLRQYRASHPNVFIEH